MTITPVLLCGGSGTRLWPLSRKRYPKQFVKLTGAFNLFQQTAQRFAQGHEPPLIVSAADFRFIVTEQLAEAGIDPGAILIEPEPRNTGPAVLAAALHLYAKDADAVILVAPSDHVVADPDGLHDAIARAHGAVSDGHLVTFGVVPSAPETGYGYLELPPGVELGKGAVDLVRFVEKPDEGTATDMLAAGNFLWNSGIFMFRADAIIAAFQTHAPHMYAAVERAHKAGQNDLGFLRLDSDAWAQAPAISIDYAVMERAAGLSVVALDCGWGDLGSWSAIWALGPRDADGVAIAGPASAIDCTNSLLRSESPDVQLVGIGLQNIVAIAMKDAVLVADMSRVEDVKLIVDRLKAAGAEQAESFAVDHRPWGWFERIAIGERFQVKRIVVHPGAALSLQSHQRRAEHWTVVQGTAQVTIGDVEKRLGENQSVYVSVGKKHRLENRSTDPLILIEVQTGAYLGEDDIERFDDVYARK